MNKHRTQLRDLILSIQPSDDQERGVLDEVAAWVEREADIYRRVRPDVPAKHLVVYFVLVDLSRRSVLLVKHRLAGLWLPTGGHVEPDEDPAQAVQRELAEELGSRAALVATVASTPLFVTQGLTRGAGAHTDVALWYVVAGDVHMWLESDSREFDGHCWMTFDEVAQMDPDELDPNMQRFIDKLRGRI